MQASRILVVEDDDDLRRLFRAVLTMAGYVVDEAPDGLDALRSIENNPPDLVILDLVLRSLDGASVQQELAARAVTSNIPVVVVTGMPDSISGPNVACVLRKPVRAEQLVQTVKQCIARGAPAPGV